MQTEVIGGIAAKQLKRIVGIAHFTVFFIVNQNANTGPEMERIKIEQVNGADRLAVDCFNNHAYLFAFVNVTLRILDVFCQNIF